jgi:hypothetical protein
MMYAKAPTMSRASSRASIIDPVSPLTLPALDAFLCGHVAPPSASGAALSRSASPVPSSSFAGGFETPRMTTSASYSSLRGLDADDPFEHQRARRLRDAKRRLRGVQRAADIRAARFARMRAACFANDTKRVQQAWAAERTQEAQLQAARERHYDKLRRAEERRQAAAEQRAEALRTAEAHRLAVRARTALLRGANNVLRQPEARSAGATLLAVSSFVNATLHAAAHTHAGTSQPSSPNYPLPPPLNADASAPYVGRARPFCSEMHGRMLHAKAVEGVEEKLVNDPMMACTACKEQAPARPVCRVTGERHQQALPHAASALLDMLLAAAVAPPTPEASPSKETRCLSSTPMSPLNASYDPSRSSTGVDGTASRTAIPSPAAASTSTTTSPGSDQHQHADDNSHSRSSILGTPGEDVTVFLQSVSTWPRLEDPAARDLVCRQLIGAHYAAVEHLCPQKKQPGVPHQSTEAFSSERLVGAMALNLARELHGLLSKLASPSCCCDASDASSGQHITHRTVIKLLCSWDAYCTSAAEEKRNKKRAAIEHLTEGYVQLRMAEVVRERDIRRTQLAASAAGPDSARALRERRVAPRRAVLSSAITSQVTTIQRKLRAIGGEEAVAAAGRRAVAVIADYERDMDARESRIFDINEGGVMPAAAGERVPCEVAC